MASSGTGRLSNWPSSSSVMQLGIGDAELDMHSQRTYIVHMYRQSIVVQFSADPCPAVYLYAYQPTH